MNRKLCVEESSPALHTNTVTEKCLKLIRESSIVFHATESFLERIIGNEED